MADNELEKQVKAAAEALYKGENANLRQFTPEVIQQQVIPATKTFQNDHFRNHEVPRMVVAFTNIGSGLLKPEHLKEVLAGTEEGIKITENMKKLAEAAHLNLPDVNKDGKFSIEDMKIDSPELRRALIDNYDALKGVYEKNGGQIPAAWKQVMAGIETTEKNDDGPMTKVIHEANSGMTLRMAAEIQKAANPEPSAQAPVQNAEQQFSVSGLNS